MADPGFRQPMLATLTEDRFSDENWIYERKLDGVRALCSSDGRQPTLWTRNGKPMNDTYPEIVEALAAQGGPRFVADGEIVAFDGSATSFSALQPRIHVIDPGRALATGVPVFYYLFDLLHYDGTDATGLPLRQRKRLLRDAFDFHDPLRYSTHRNTDGERYFEQACSRGWEGLIAKRADARYRGGRSKDWLKFKCVTGQEFVIGGFTDPQGGRTGLGALLLGYYTGSDLHYAGKVGTGFDRATLATLTKRLGALERGSSPFSGVVRERGSHWVDPELVAQIEFSEWTRDGKLRHPRYVGLRVDKRPDTVVRESAPDRPQTTGRTGPR